MGRAEKDVIVLDGLRKVYGGEKAAVKQLGFGIGGGQIFGFLGCNGAGKTTMMDVITGKTRPDAGQAWFGQTFNLLRMDEPEIAQAGIGRKFQKPTVFTEHTVFENLELTPYMLNFPAGHGTACLMGTDVEDISITSTD